MRFKVIAALLIFNFFAVVAFSQSYKLLRSFQKSINIDRGTSLKPDVHKEFYTINLLTDSVFTLTHGISSCLSYSTITGKYFIEKDTVYFYRDSATDFTESDLISIFNQPFVRMRLLDKQLQSFNGQDTGLELNELVLQQPSRNNKKTTVNKRY